MLHMPPYLWRRITESLFLIIYHIPYEYLHIVIHSSVLRIFTSDVIPKVWLLSLFFNKMAHKYSITL
jgi:hypothetical protein